MEAPVHGLLLFAVGKVLTLAVKKLLLYSGVKFKGHLTIFEPIRVFDRTAIMTRE